MNNQTTITFVLDCPDEAAAELAQLRKLKAELITTLAPALERLTAPVPPSLDVLMQCCEYAERSGYALGAIRDALVELRK